MSAIRVVKVPIEPLTPTAFAPFGDVIERFEDAEPEILKGSFRNKEIPIDQVRLQQTHWAYHTDAGQSFYPKNNTRCVFMVGPIGETLEHGDVRAFYAAGGLGIVVKIGVWHTFPITLDGNEVFLSARGDADYMEHSVEIEFDRDQGIAFEADVTTL